jgi:hypothetical protein
MFLYTTRRPGYLAKGLNSKLWVGFEVKPQGPRQTSYTDRRQRQTHLAAGLGAGSRGRANCPD